MIGQIVSALIVLAFPQLIYSILEEAWSLYLQGSHFVRMGVEGLGRELQRRGITRHAQWGAQGIV
jgi:uncharacterized ion transporter superfamily protein YfcC